MEKTLIHGGKTIASLFYQQQSTTQSTILDT